MTDGIEILELATSITADLTSVQILYPTAVCAGRQRLIDYTTAFVVTLCRNGFGNSGNFFTAYRARNNRIVATVCGTGNCNLVFDGCFPCGVTERGDFDLRYKNRAAIVSTMTALGISGGGAGRFYRIQNCRAVSNCLLDHAFASGAVLILLAGGRTVCIVSERIALLFATYSTMHGVRAIRICKNVIFGALESTAFCIVNQLCVTYVNACVIAVGTGGWIDGQLSEIIPFIKQNATATTFVRIDCSTVFQFEYTIGNRNVTLKRNTIEYDFGIREYANIKSAYNFTGFVGRSINKGNDCIPCLQHKVRGNGKGSAIEVDYQTLTCCTNTVYGGGNVF